MINPGEILLKSDSNGKFFANYLNAGAYSLEISKEHYLTQNYTEQVEDGTTIDNSYQILLLGSISGTVTGYATGNPLSDVKISTIPVTKSTETDENGNYKLEFLEAGDYVLKIKLEGYTSQEEDVSVEYGITTEKNIQYLLSPQGYVYVEGGSFDMGDIWDLV